MSEARTLRAGAIASVLGWGSGIGMILATKGSDVQGSETVELKDKLVAIVQHDPGLVLKVMGFDAIFIMAYITLFTALYAHTPRDGRKLAAVALGLGLVAAGSDLLENAVYMVMALSAQHGGVVSPELPFQYYDSTIKWLAAFSAVGLFTLVFPRRNWLETATAAVMAAFPLGGALSIAFPQFAPLRGLFFIVGLPMFAVLLFRRAAGLGPKEIAQ